jgi:hypothetical protein
MPAAAYRSLGRDLELIIGFHDLWLDLNIALGRRPMGKTAVRHVDVPQS